MVSRLNFRSVVASRLVSVSGSALLSILLLASCSLSSLPSGSSGGGSNSSSSKACTNIITKTFTPLSITSGQTLVFDSSAFAFLNDSNFVPTSIVLRVQYDKKPAQKSNMSVGLNGLECSRPDGRRGFDDDDSRYPSSSVLHLENMNVGGGLLAALMLADIQRRGGQVKIATVGSGLKAVSAVLEVQGYYKNACNVPTPTPTATPKPTPTATPSASPTPKPTATPVPTPLPTATPTPTPVPVAPVVKIDMSLPSDSPVSQTTIQFAFSADQADASFTCVLDSTAEAACASPMIYSGLANGAHKFTVNALSSQGLRSVTAADHSWTIDTVASPVTIQPVAALSNSASQKVTFSATESGVYYCSLDGVAPAVCTSPLSISGLQDGMHQIAIYLIDTVGNRGDLATAAWRVDLTPPVVQILTVMPADAISASTTRQFTFSANESSTFECSVDGVGFSTCASPLVLNALSEGAHRFDVHAIDAAGNIGLAATSMWTSDYTAPTLVISSVQPAAGKTNSTTYSFDVLSSEPGSLVCSVDGAVEGVCVSPIAGSFATAGMHTVSVAAIDQAGNRSAGSSVSWMVEFVAPAISFASFNPSSSAFISSPMLVVSINATASETLSASLNGVDLGAVTPTITLSSLTEGSYDLEVNGTDDFGNATNSLSHKFVVDLTAPVLTLSSSVPSGALTQAKMNTLTFSENEASSVECQLDGAGFSACASPFSVSNLIDGAHELDVRATDLAGNVSPASSVSWTIDTTAPVTQSQATQTSGQSFSIAISANEASTFVQSVDGAAETAAVSPLVLALSVGSHNVVVRAIDSAGNRDSQGVSFNLTSYAAPTTALTANTGGTNTKQTSAAFTFSSNLSSATFVCSINGAAATACTSPLNLSGLSDGQRVLKVQAVDAWGAKDAVGASYTWTVDTTAPVISGQTANSTSSSVTVSWTTSESATSFINWGQGFDTSRTTIESSVEGTRHTVTISGLINNTVYTIRPSGHDAAGNAYFGTVSQIRTQF